ncbi:MAG: hypothetical protein WB822_14870 [Rhodoplanes sp.]
MAILSNKRPYPRRNWIKAVPEMQNAVSIGMIAADPTAGIKSSVKIKSEGFATWREKQIAAFRRHHAIGTRARLAFELLLCTMQRRGDVIRVGPQHLRGEPLRLPIFPELQEALDAAPSWHLTFLATAHGKPFTSAGFGNWFR